MEGGYTLLAEYNDIGRRIDLWITEEFEELSRNAVQRLIDSGFVTINGKNVKSNYKLRENDFASIYIPAPSEADILPENIELDILYEDEGMAVINKPRGMVVHPASGHYSGTLVNALLYRFKDSLSGINGELRPGIVHRLDKDTSGVIAVAKNDFYHKSLSEQLQTREMSRVYKALVYGSVKNEENVIDNYIGRHPVDRKKMAVVAEQSGRRAITHYSVIKRFSNPPMTLIEARLKTGRTHQIRVHMAYIGYPVAGDEVYGREKQRFRHLDGQILHAEKIGFIHPKTGGYVEACAPLPDYFKDIMSKLGE